MTSKPLAATVEEIAAENFSIASAALHAIAELKPQPYAFPADWQQQIAACDQCARWRDHPIQRGICDAHRRPLYERDEHDRSERLAIGNRAIQIAVTALFQFKAPPPSPQSPPSL